MHLSDYEHEETSEPCTVLEGASPDDGRGTAAEIIRALGVLPEAVSRRFAEAIPGYIGYCIETGIPGAAEQMSQQELLKRVVRVLDAPEDC